MDALAALVVAQIMAVAVVVAAVTTTTIGPIVVGIVAVVVAATMTEIEIVVGIVAVAAMTRTTGTSAAMALEIRVVVAGNHVTIRTGRANRGSRVEETNQAAGRSRPVQERRPAAARGSSREVLVLLEQDPQRRQQQL